MLVDYHMHLRSPREDVEELEHTVSAIERYVERARELGVGEIGFTEHGYYFAELREVTPSAPGPQRNAFELDGYVTAVLDAKREGLPVKLGLEVDYVRGCEDELRDLLSPYPWDYLLGSVHWVDGEAVDSRPGLWERLPVDSVWRRYFDELGAAAASGLFDSLSHPDLVKIWGLRPDVGLVRELEESAASTIADAGVAAEVSAAGLRKPVGEIYPATSFLTALRAREVPITTASDAHLPKNVGDGAAAVVDHARAAGYETVTVFEARVACQEPLG